MTDPAAGTEPRTPGGPSSGASATVGVSLTILGSLFLSVVVYLVLLTPLEQARNQKVLYDAFRVELAAATAPVSALDFEGQPVAAGEPIALVRIPDLDIDQVVVLGTTPRELKRGPGLRRDSAWPGTVGTSVVFGRQSAFGGPFDGIESLQLEREILVTTGSGEWVYEVQGIRRQGSVRVVPEAGEALLTLVSVTGTPYLPGEPVYVDARLVGEPGPAVVRSARPGTLPATDDIMGVDPGGLPDVLLWSLGLLAAALGAAWGQARWGRWQTWVVTVPLCAALVVGLLSSLSNVLPNLI